MATVPPETILPSALPGVAVESAPEALAERWAALHAKAATLALLARIGAEPDATGSALPTLIAHALPWQRALVGQGIDDCEAMLDAGLAALATLSARGQDTAVPALALWREIHAARAAMMAMLQVPEAV